MVFEDVAGLVVSEGAVSLVVVMVGMGIDSSALGCHGVGVEYDESVGASHDDMAQTGLKEHGHGAHEGIFGEQAAELVGAVGLWKGETEGSGVDGYPYASATVAEDVEYFSWGPATGCR